MTRTARTITMALAVVAALASGGIAPAFADVSPTQHLPAAACNAGTMNAHSRVPETTGNGTQSSRTTPSRGQPT